MTCVAATGEALALRAMPASLNILPLYFVSMAFFPLIYAGIRNLPWPPSLSPRRHGSLLIRFIVLCFGVESGPRSATAVAQVRIDSCMIQFCDSVSAGVGGDSIRTGHQSRPREDKTHDRHCQDLRLAMKGVFHELGIAA
jgi:hypothetical protein